MSLSSLLANIHLKPEDNEIHIFSESPPELSQLSQLLITTSLLRDALQRNSVDPDQRLVSLLKEHSSHSDALQRLENERLKRLEALSARTRPHLYGEDVPSSKALIPEYVTSRIERCIRATGIEVFKDHEDNSTVFVCGGKVLVLDITLLDHTQARAGTSKPPETTISLSSLKISHAPPADDSPAQPVLPSDALLSSLLADTLRSFISECHSEQAVTDGINMGILLKKFQTHLEYLVALDGIAAEDPEGVRWLREISLVTEEATAVLRSEAASILSIPIDSRPPTDVVLRRGHAIPLAYLTGPTLSFLVNLSPPAYLSLARRSKPQGADNLLDIKTDDLRSFLNHHLKSARSITDGTSYAPYLFTIGTLSVSHSTHPALFRPLEPSIEYRPTYSLAQKSAQLEGDNNMQLDLPADIRSMLGHTFPIRHGITWMLDFTTNLAPRNKISEKGNKGIWVRQTAMREIARVVGFSSDASSVQVMPWEEGLGGGHGSLNLDLGFGTLGAGHATWFDRLVQQGHAVPSVQYTARITSATHPPIHATTLAPLEPGFFLSGVPVSSMKQVHAILEIVRDQCWLDEFLRSAPWQPEGLDQRGYYGPTNFDSTPEGELDLDALLNGLYTPNMIPTTLDIRHINESADMQMRLTFPLPSPGSPLCSITVSADASSPRGIKVKMYLVEGIIDEISERRESWFDAMERSAEEFLRRGGGISVVGWIWKKAKDRTSNSIATTE